jgi:hypothetical protein
VPGNSTVNLDFQTQAGMRQYDLRAGETFSGNCVVGADQQQALALAGFREDSQDEQGRWVTLTRLGEKLGLTTGWK